MARDRPRVWLLIEQRTVRSIRSILGTLPYGQVADVIKELDDLDAALFPDDEAHPDPEGALRVRI